MGGSDITLPDGGSMSRGGEVYAFQALFQSMDALAGMAVEETKLCDGEGMLARHSIRHVMLIIAITASPFIQRPSFRGKMD